MTETSSALDVLDRRIGDDPEMRRMIAEETVSARVAQAIYDLRIQAGLTQRALAQLVGTTQPVIARLEDADYRGRSLRMLIRIAGALGRELDVRFVGPGTRKARPVRRKRPAFDRLTGAL